MKKGIKKLGILSLSILLGLGLIACGDSSSKTKEETPEFVYVPEYISLPEGANTYNAVVSNNKVYFTKGETNETTGEYKENFCYMEIGETEPVELALNLEQNEYVTSYTVDQAGNIYQIIQKSSYDEATQVEDSQFRLVKMLPDGTIEFSQDITSVLKEEEYAYIQYTAIDSAGNIYLTNGESKIWLFDNKGSALGVISITDYINGMSVTKEGTVVVLVYGTDGYIMKEIDIAKKAFGLTYDGIPSGNGNVYVAPGIETGVLISAGNKLSEYNTTTKEYNEILSWINCDVNFSYISELAVLEDGRIAVLVNNYSRDQSTTEIILLTKKDYASVEQKETITYGTLYSDSDVMEQIIAFNKTNEKYRIEVKEYGTDDYTSGVTQMNNEIISGNGPDIMSVTYGTSINQYVAKGVLADLSSYVDNDPEIKRENYLENVFNAYSKDGKLYAIIPSFMITTVMGKTSDVGTEMGWTVKDLMALVASKPEGTEVFEYATKSSMLSTMVMYSLDQFINWETGECSFNTKEFQDIMEFSNTFETEANYDESGPSTPEKIQAGSLLLAQTSFSGVQEYQMYQLMFDEPVTFIGYPTNEGTGSAIQPSGVTLAVNAKSDKLDGAWEFIRTFLLDDYQNNMDYYFPVSKTALDKVFEKAMTPEYTTDENGEKIETVKTSWGWGNFNADIYAATQEDKDALMGLINSVTTVSDYDEQIYKIVLEEAEGYFTGSKSVADVADVIQSRIQIYISESR